MDSQSNRPNSDDVVHNVVYHVGKISFFTCSTTMADAMLRSEEGKTAAMSATKDTLKDTNMSKGKGKKVSPPPVVPSTSKDDRLRLLTLKL